MIILIKFRLDQEEYINIFIRLIIYRGNQKDFRFVSYVNEILINYNVKLYIHIYTVRSL